MTLRPHFNPEGAISSVMPFYRRNSISRNRRNTRDGVSSPATSTRRPPSSYTNQ